MSRDRNDGKHGKFHLVGEVYPELIVMDSLTSTYLTGHYSENLFNANHEIIQKIKADSRGIDFNQYDCYINGTDQYGEDGQIDMIIIWYRFFCDYYIDGCNVSMAALGGSSIWKDSLGQAITLGGKKIGSRSGITLCGEVTLKGTKTLAHEYGHYFFGSRHYPLLGKYAVMGGCQTMHGYERERLGWIDPIILNTTRKDLKITDAILTGVVYKIPADEAGKKYFYLENRQRSTYWDKIVGDGDDGCDHDQWRIIPETGLLITYLNKFRISVIKPDSVNRIPFKTGQTFPLDIKANSYSHDNQDTGFYIENIREVGEDLQDIIVDVKFSSY